MIRSVLVVDDSAAMREYIAETLRKAGYDVLEAADGLEALARLDEEVRLGLIVTDLQMPNMDGYELIHRLRATPINRHLPIVVLTCDNDPRRGDEVKAFGADAALTKPFRRDDLLDAVAGLLH